MFNLRRTRFRLHNRDSSLHMLRYLRVSIQDPVQHDFPELKMRLGRLCLGNPLLNSHQFTTFEHQELCSLGMMVDMRAGRLSRVSFGRGRICALSLVLCAVHRSGNTTFGHRGLLHWERLTTVSPMHDFCSRPAKPGSDQSLTGRHRRFLKRGMKNTTLATRVPWSIYSR
ncbi:hypothetical protein DENSPDRAFT_474801 [Dentipellis sp. KUC8613]|nr:hypothetical protein DENSPDRAFT_474801 [Dentipellis sp. KUC8613]